MIEELGLLTIILMDIIIIEFIWILAMIIYDDFKEEKAYVKIDEDVWEHLKENETHHYDELCTQVNEELYEEVFGEEYK